MRDELIKIWPADGCQTVLDLGCRDCWFTADLPGVRRHVGVDIWEPALQLAQTKAQAGHLPHFEGVQAGVLDYLEAQPDGAFEAVLAIDLLEHMDPMLAHGLLAQMERVASKVAIVWTTLGMIQQGPHDVDGNQNPYEAHVWGPSIDLFQARSWEILEYPKWHGPRGGAILSWLLKS